MNLKLLFTGLPVYVLLYKNRVKIYRLDTGKSLDRVSTISFSNSRLLWADYQQGEIFLKSLINELLFDDNFFLQPPLNMLIHQIEMKNESVSPVEKRALLDSSKHMNAKETFLCFDENELTLKEAFYRINNKKGIKSVY